MKVDWNPFDKNNPLTWPENGSVVWLTNQVHLCLAVVEIMDGYGDGSDWVFFDAYKVNGQERELFVNEDNATHWAPADLPELPQ